MVGLVLWPRVRSSMVLLHLSICTYLSFICPPIQEMHIWVLTESWALARYCDHSCDLDKTLSLMEFVFL